MKNTTNWGTLFRGVWFSARSEEGYMYCNEAGHSVPIDSLVAPEGIEYLKTAVNAATDADSFDTMKRIGEYVVEMFPAL